MARKPFVVLDAEILSSSVWSEAAHVRLVWITLLILCDTEGYVGASVPGIARAAGVSLAEAQDAMERLQAPDPYSRTKASEGRRVELVERGFRVLNFLEHLDRLSAERTKARERVRRHRERQKKRNGNVTDPDGNVTVRPGSSDQGRSVASAPGSLSSPPVSVGASVVSAPVSPLAKPVAASKQTWLTPFGDDWREAYGGEPSWGEMAKVLKMPVDALGANEVRTRWRMYLGRTDGQYASPTRFAQTIGIWTEDAVARMQPRDMRSMTVGDFNAATYERVMKRLQERSHEGQGAIAEGSAQARGLLSD